ncbi:MAG: chemotaxis protein CheD [Methyloprofundus sp.]|nr:MAG: chemotaxis protein CheD [Methyloprofundus sp.]
MKTLPYKQTQRIIIDPGEYYVSSEQEIISTLLGSCVAACLYDPVNRIIGMNHFLLAYRHHAHSVPLLDTEEARYGMYAMELLINEMMQHGASKLNLKAKCFGGGNVLHLREDKKNKETIGDVNIAFIKEFLKNEKIPLMGGCLGGKFGRNIHFVGGDFSVYVKRIENNQTQQLEQEERQYWKKSVAEHEHAQSQAEFW